MTTQPPPSLPIRLGELWDLACKGDEAYAYRELLRLQLRHPGQVDVCLRLYWLLVAAPELDERRSACDWLARGLHASAMAGPLRELYRRELVQNPAEALSMRCARLLYSRIHAKRALELARWRWQAAVQLNRWDILDTDLDELKPWLRPHSPEVWSELLVTGAELVAWAGEGGPQALFQKMGDEIASLDSLASQCPTLGERYAFALRVRACWSKFKPRRCGPPGLVPLLQRANVLSKEETQPLVSALTEQLACRPEEGLKQLAEVQARAVPFLIRLAELLEPTEPDAREPRFPASLNRLILDFLDGLGRHPYEELRLPLLGFCLREAIAPETVAEVLTARPDAWLRPADDLNRSILADWALRCVYAAHRRFWN